MSHFSVLVVGNDPEVQLSPFDEGLAMPAYDSGLVSKGDKNSFMEHYSKEGKLPPGTSFARAYAMFGGDWNDNRWRRNWLGIWVEWTTYNPKSKWDWHQIGGRFSGSILAKNGQRVDSCLWGDIDFERMMEEAAEKASGEYDRLHAIVNGRTIPVWSAIRKAHKEDIDAARKEYHEHPVTVDLNLDPEFKEMFCWHDSAERFAVNKDVFIRRAKASAFRPFAVLRDGKWHERGRMGWWGAVSDEKGEDAWSLEFSSITRDIPENIVVTVFDCHI